MRRKRRRRGSAAAVLAVLPLDYRGRRVVTAEETEHGPRFYPGPAYADGPGREAAAAELRRLRPGWRLSHDEAYAWLFENSSALSFHGV